MTNVDRLSKVAYWLVLLMPISIAVEVIILGEINFGLLSILGLAYLMRSKEPSYYKEKWVRAFVLFFTYIFVRSLFAEEALVSVKRVAPFVRFGLFLITLQYLYSTHKTNYIKLYNLTCITLLFFFFF